MEGYLAITGSAIAWFQSYLGIGLHQWVILNDECSAMWRAIQVAILELLLFSLYMKGLRSDEDHANTLSLC